MDRQPFLQHFGIPNPLIRLISGYLFYFKSDNAIEELLEFNKTKVMTSNIVFYCLPNNLVPSGIGLYIHLYSESLLFQLINFYEPYMKQLLTKLYPYVHKGTWDESHKLSHIDFNLLDFIAITACIRKNAAFIKDFIIQVNYAYKFQFRTNVYGNRIHLDIMYIAEREIIEYFAKMDDVDSMDFAFRAFGVDTKEMDAFFIYDYSSWLSMYKMLELPKLSKYREEYIKNFSNRHSHDR